MLLLEDCINNHCLILKDSLDFSIIFISLIKANDLHLEYVVLVNFLHSFWNTAITYWFGSVSYTNLMLIIKDHLPWVLSPVLMSGGFLLLFTFKKWVKINFTKKDSSVYETNCNQSGPIELFQKINNERTIGKWELIVVKGKIHISEFWFEEYGKTSHMITPLSDFVEAFDPSHKLEILNAYTNLLHSQAPFDKITRVKCFDGRKTWVRIIGCPVLNKEITTGANGIFINVDKEKNGQIALEKLSKKYAMAQNAAAFGIWDWNINNGIIDCDKKIFDLYGLRYSNRMPRFKDWLYAVHPGDQKRILKEIGFAINGQGKFDTSFRIVQPNGEVKMIRALAEIHRNEQGHVTNLVGTNWDVSAEYRQTKALENSEKVMKEAQSIANFGNFDFDVQRNQLNWSAHMHQIFDPVSSFDFTFESFINMFHPDDQEKLLAQVHMAIDMGKRIEIELRIIQSSGAIRKVFQKARVYYNQEGKAVKIIGTVQDVTEERELQEKLKINLSYQQMLTFVSLILNKPGDFDEKIESAFEELGKGIDACRAYVFKNDFESKKLIPTHQWICEPLKNSGLELKSINFHYLSSFELLFNEWIINNQIDALPEKLRAVFHSWGAKSILIFPLFIDNKFEGFIGFEDTKEKRGWGIEEVRHLETASGIIANAFRQYDYKLKLLESKKKYKDLYDRTPAMMYSSDTLHKLLGVSEYWLERMEYESSEVLGREIMDFMSPKSQELFQECFYKKIREEGKCKNLPLQFIKKSGETMEVLLSAISDENSKGPIDTISTVIIDVTKEREAENKIIKLNENLESKVKARTEELEKISNKLITHKNLLEGFINVTPSIIYLKDANGKYLLVNKMFKELFKVENQQVVGKTDFEIFPESFAKEFAETDKTIISKREIVESEDLINYGDKVNNYMSVKFPLYDAEQQEVFIGGVFTDITLRKRQEEKVRFQAEELRVSNEILKKKQEMLKRSQKQLIMINQELEGFSYSVSHDLRAPLRALEGFSGLLTDEYNEVLDERGKKWLNFISTNTTKMDRLIKDILEFSRISRSRICKQQINIEKMVAEVIEEETVNYPSHKLEIDCKGLLDCYADKNIIRQVWVNLISNAFKYSSKKEMISISVNSVETDKSIQYTIMDNGEGFDEKYLDKLFGVFQRLHREQDFKGTGVGLAIVKKIINKHGGEIKGESKEGEGATFTFHLPKD